MPDQNIWRELLHSGALAPRFATLYGSRADSQTARYLKALDMFEALFGAGRELHIFSGPGRTEIGGNHTDHNHGKVLAGAVNLDVLALVSRREEPVVRIHSEGHEENVVSLDELAFRPEELGMSTALVRGICAQFAERADCALGGLDVYTTSDVLTGSGLSSSAAFEVLVGQIFNQLFNGGRLSPLALSIMARRAENEYFGKPCGLMDQLASATGGLVGIDFADVGNPIVRQVKCDLAASGHHLCIVSTGGSHADLTAAYAAVPAEMSSVARALGADVLRHADEGLFWQAWPGLRDTLGDRPLLRAAHFFEENRRVDRQMDALEKNDIAAFLSLLKESGRSSFMYLQNVYPQEDWQGLSLALCLSEHVLGGAGAFRVHGGGFAGTMQAFVPDDRLKDYVAAMDALFGAGACQVLAIRPAGSVQVHV